LSQILETGLKLLAITTLIEFPRGIGEFFCRNVPTLFGGELEGCPVSLRLRAIIALIEMIETLRRANEQRAAYAVTQGGSQHFGPAGRMHRGIFIEHNEIQPLTAKRIVLISSAQCDHTPPLQCDIQIGLVGPRGPIGPGQLFEAVPGDALRLFIGGP
jgi:hypothetical protein